MVAALAAAAVPLLAAGIPALVNAFKRPATPPAPTAAPIPSYAMQPAVQPMPQYALTPQGQMVQLPAQQQAALMQLGQQYQHQSLQDHAQLVGRAQVRHVTGAIDPQLQAIQRQLNERSTQIQATAEHRAIQERQKFERQVLGRLATIERAARIMRY